ncbi:Undecaprenyl-phosphate galactose phosphotransferase, WbaP/exopolysaccharide biosynthesis polyprenyl glycosylphosphotransferase [Quadrisphaera granulorum]|uniref:Undecaprenyl-phosphate galactose phosphotransferase WbaP/exopolysaccharide biosynthesis polyprenyl glycosylphosphotransferase n=1 Tax=Quadrisphaera granulorum TaxID=317664 RepID=A0A316AE32_9ACTN|nr:sugar transferase [Quadrisphaera granulorum]PWJ56035.1 Undecaprenyl-phosphate galactose phosphotransferase WbaP/exopolysaccharide biosynthesis polyprenyl glycosylphosphotransferase [Quadrisphaera granulorum]SZE94669.1 Undecaprenyl-phosphate galactose phosphotransferase, WbaP/exopolysaccharide biosynthesis polyprenyl glycosylphosphotransferase [Quadrisphaera granulorum]
MTHVVHPPQEAIGTLPRQNAGSTGGAGGADRRAPDHGAPGRLHRVPRPRTHWTTAYLRRVVAADAVAILAATSLAYVFRFGAVSTSAWEGALLLLGVPALWFGALYVNRAYESRFMGLGSEEYGRVGRASTAVLALLATASWAFQLEIARGYVLLALPVGTVLLLVLRYLTRQHLHAQRERGLHTQSLLVAGHHEGVLATVRQVRRARYHGMVVIGVCLPDAHGGRRGGEASVLTQLAEMDVPVLGTLADVSEVSLRHGVDAVAILPTAETDAAFLRHLGWELEDTHADLFVAPTVTEVVGPRVAIRPVCGLPLLHLERPELTGSRRIAKQTVDRVAAAVAIALLSPGLLAIALAVKLDSRGPVLFRQERIGLEGRTFGMLKFRSMVVDAEARLRELAGSSEGNAVLFKMKHDPRVTRVGRFLRRYSLDELPQLFNVLVGQMSLVGPRPPLAREVAVYEHDARRKLLVKPGLTGLWQINGRSDLDWEESLRLDLRYVENWSFAYDFMILWKTVGAVLRSRGAY